MVQLEPIPTNSHCSTEYSLHDGFPLTLGYKHVVAAYLSFTLKHTMKMHVDNACLFSVQAVDVLPRCSTRHHKQKKKNLCMHIRRSFMRSLTRQKRQATIGERTANRIAAAGIMTPSNELKAHELGVTFKRHRGSIPMPKDTFRELTCINPCLHYVHFKQCLQLGV